uniref:Uncharacterized protein n=1 Tax=Picea sitchensis TaxID=3332 RepID=A9NNU6_PICSI|nr:unknown [Picea sitchensis]
MLKWRMGIRQLAVQQWDPLKPSCSQVLHLNANGRTRGRRKGSHTISPILLQAPMFRFAGKNLPDILK